MKYICQAIPILLLISSINLAAQPQHKINFTNKPYYKHHVGVKLGYSFSQAFEVGIGYGLEKRKDRYPVPWMPEWVAGATLGGEIYRYANTTRVAPKLSVEFHKGFLGGRLSVVNYHLGTQQNDTRLIPEVGLSFSGFAQVFYGRSNPVTSLDESLQYLPKNRISLAINLALVKIKTSKIHDNHK
ncbi:MAG: hypothetical protein ACFB0B_04525 [Thermonemataceae bacterium]